jgi:hypothetical protein
MIWHHRYAFISPSVLISWCRNPETLNCHYWWTPHRGQGPRGQVTSRMTSQFRQLLYAVSTTPETLVLICTLLSNIHYPPLSVLIQIPPPPPPPPATSSQFSKRIIPIMFRHKNFVGISYWCQPSYMLSPSLLDVCVIHGLSCHENSKSHHFLICFMYK